jgi:outer membrane protein, heavy metal efflux system
MPYVRDVLALFCLVVSVSSAAQSGVIELREFLDIVARNNPDLIAANQQRSLAQAGVTTSRAYPNPDIELGAGPWRSRIGPTSGTLGTIGISQTLELPSVRSLRESTAIAGLGVTDAQILATRVAVGYAARGAYYEFRRRAEDERLARENLALLEQIQGRVLKQVAVGEAPRFELVRVEAEALGAQNQLASARLRLDEARATMRRLAGGALPASFDSPGSLPEVTELPRLEKIQEEMLENQPLLKALQAERDRASKRLELERAQRNPAPTLRLQQSRDPEARQLFFGVSVPLPLWNRREGPIAEAQANVDIASAQIEVQRSQLLRELDSAYARLSIAQRQIDTFESGLLRSAELTLQAAETAYRAGERGFLEVLDAQRTRRTVRSDFNQARFEKLAAWQDIGRLTARDPFASDRP